jgi:hypothetical protein
MEDSSLAQQPKTDWLKQLPALVWSVRIATVVLAIMQAYVMRHYLNEDGVSYLDLGDAWLRGDWDAAINGTWSPLYPMIVGNVLAIVQPTPYWEFATVKMVNVAILLLSMAAFDWFLHEIILLQRQRREQSQTSVPLPDLVLRLLAWLVFLTASLNMTNVGFVTPDLLVNLFGFLAAAVVARARRLTLAWYWALLLGVIIGLGYLTKAPLLPMGMIFLFMYLVNVRGWRRRLIHLTSALVVIAVIAGPYIVALSDKLDRWTFTDASRINYLWFVNRVEKCRWQTEREDLGNPIHPPKTLHVNPDLYDYSEPIAGTQPLWYDPGYWCEGLTPRFVAADQLGNLQRMSTKFLGIIVQYVGAFLLGTVLLGFLSWSTVADARKWRLAASSLAKEYPSLFIPLLASAMYVLVYVEERYLAMYAVLAIVGLLASIRYSPEKWEYLQGRVLFVAVLFAVPAIGMIGWHAMKSWQEWQAGEGGHAHRHWQIAHEMEQLGLRPGDGVGVVGYPLDCGWARLGGFRILAEINEMEAPGYWRASAEEKRRIAEIFRNIGAKAIVFVNPPQGLADGVLIPDTQYQIHILHHEPGETLP